MDVEASNEAIAYPSYATIHQHISSSGMQYVLVVNCAPVFITMLPENLQGEGDLFEDWTTALLGEFVNKLASTSAPGTQKLMTLRKYFESPFFAFSYVNKEGGLVAIQEEYKPETHGDWTPKTPIVDSLPQSNAAPNGASNVLRSSLPPVPLIPASELVRVDESEHEVSQVPKESDNMDWIPSCASRLGLTAMTT
ncbi:hypothetical protein EDB80DRAFT_865195 [Ilyonectria destructans]|nr:hypothetical protein EDB80DRAFT_865195 [Ilyonectria destructans]